MKLTPNRIPGLAPDTQTYLQNIQAAGGSILAGSLQAVDQFVRDCRNTGVWDRLTEVCPLAGNDLPTALVKLKYNSASSMTSVNFVAGDYTEQGANGGLLGNGSTKHLNLNHLCSLVPAAAHLSLYLRETANTVHSAFGAANSGQTERCYIGSSTGSNAITALGVTTYGIMPASMTPGFYMGHRASSTSLNLYLNDVSVASSASPTTPNYPALDIYAFAWNNNGAPSSYINKRMSFLSVGLDMTDAQRTAFYNAVLTLQTKLNRNV